MSGHIPPPGAEGAIDQAALTYLQAVQQALGTSRAMTSGPVLRWLTSADRGVTQRVTARAQPDRTRSCHILSSGNRRSMIDLLDDSWFVAPGEQMRLITAQLEEAEREMTRTILGTSIEQREPGDA